MPDSSVSSTRYALAAHGQEYVVFQPDEGDFTMELPPGAYGVQWFSLTDRSWTNGNAVSVEDASATRLQPPTDAGAWVLHLRNQSG